MANYNTNLKRNKTFVAFLKSLKPGWLQEGGKIVLVDGRFHCRTTWLPHEGWWQAYVQADRNHLKEHEIAAFAAVIAAGEDCTLTVSALRFLEFIAQYYCEMSGKRSLKTAPAIEQESADEPRTALLALAEYCIANNINTRKMRVETRFSANAENNTVIAVIAGQYLEFDRNGLIKKPAKKISRFIAMPADLDDLDCPF